MPKIKNHEFAQIPEYCVAQSKDFVEKSPIVEEPAVWLLRYSGFSRLTCNASEAQAAKAQGAGVTEYLPLEDATQTAHPGMSPMERLRECEDVLRSLASYLGAGGYNAPYVDPKQFHDKIMWGIQQIQQGEMV